MERGKTCDRCGGVVDVTIVPKERAGGTSILARIGACRSCGRWFNEAGLMSLDWADPHAPTAGDAPNRIS
jgi:hypothetical protein